MTIAVEAWPFYTLIGSSAVAEAIGTIVVPISILIRTTIVPRRILICTTGNVTDDLCSLIKLCFAFIMVNFST